MSARSGACSSCPRAIVHVHGLRTGEGFITGLFLQWRDGKQVNMWPEASSPRARSMFPAFVKVGQIELTRGPDASMLFWQILIDGFAISSLYALGATGFTLIFGVTGVLNLSHGGLMVAAAVAAWAAGSYWGLERRCRARLIGIAVCLALAILATYGSDRAAPATQRAKSARRRRRSLSSPRRCSGAS